MSSSCPYPAFRRRRTPRDHDDDRHRRDRDRRHDHRGPGLVRPEQPNRQERQGDGSERAVQQRDVERCRASVTKARTATAARRSSAAASAVASASPFGSARPDPWPDSGRSSRQAQRHARRHRGQRGGGSCTWRASTVMFVRADERQLARQCEEPHHAERIQVAPRVHALAQHLLRAHELGRPHTRWGSVVMPEPTRAIPKSDTSARPVARSSRCCRASHRGDPPRSCA